ISDTREKLQMAGMVAAVAAVSGDPVTVFVSMNALPYFLKDSAKKASNEGKMGELLEQKNAPAFMQLFEQAVEYGDAKVYPCSMAMDVMGVTDSDVLPFVKEPLGLTKFMSDAEKDKVMVF
ncbi:MAG: DsrE/DsrF/DrsH-like family protein, partial [Burkholderiales bacterium]